MARKKFSSIKISFISQQELRARASEARAILALCSIIRWNIYRHPDARTLLFLKYDYLQRASRFSLSLAENRFLHPHVGSYPRCRIRRSLSDRRRRSAQKRRERPSKQDRDETLALYAYGKVDGRIKNATGCKLQKFISCATHTIKNTVADASIVITIIMGKNCTVNSKDKKRPYTTERLS